MKMVPFHDMYGTILGHVDLDMCHRTRTSVMVDNSPPLVPTEEDRKTISPDDTVEIFHIPLRELKFRCRSEEVTVLHLVVEADDIPSWFWDSKAVVDFITGSWQLVHP